MTTLLVTAAHRHCRPGQPSGFLFTVDLDARKVTGECPVIEPPHIENDPNPRGGMRGAKGIAVYGDDVFVANASVIHRFDSSWNVVGTISHPSCATIHDIVIRDDTLWVASCSNDLVFQFALDGRVLRHINFRGHPGLLADLGWKVCNRLTPDAVRSGALDFRDPRSHRHETFDGCHVNSLCFLPNGDLLVLLGIIWSRKWAFLHVLKDYLEKARVWKPLARVVGPVLRRLPMKRVPRGDIGVSLASAKSALVRVGPDGVLGVIWTLADRTSPTHSLAALPDGTIYFDDTTAGEVVHFDPAGRAELSRTKVTNEFLRGLCPLPGRRAVAGSQRDVLLVDLDRGAVVERIRLTDNPNVSVYDIKVLPPGFDPLPDRLDDRAAARSCGREVAGRV